MSADLFLVFKELRFLEFTDELHQLLRGERLLQRIATGSEISLGRLGRPDQRLAGQIEDHVEGIAALRLLALEVDGADRATGFHALAVCLAFVEIDLVGEIDRLLGANADAGVATRAGFEIDRVRLFPLDLERAEISGHSARFSGKHRVTAHRGKLVVFGGPRHQNADRKLFREAVGPLQRRCPGTDDQQAPAGLVGNHRHRFGLGQICER